MKESSNYLELAQLPDGSIVLRRSDDHDNPIVKAQYIANIDNAEIRNSEILLRSIKIIF